MTSVDIVIQNLTAVMEDVKLLKATAPMADINRIIDKTTLPSAMSHGEAGLQIALAVKACVAEITNCHHYAEKNSPGKGAGIKTKVSDWRHGLDCEERRLRKLWAALPDEETRRELEMDEEATALSDEICELAYVSLQRVNQTISILHEINFLLEPNRRAPKLLRRAEVLSV